MFYTKTQPNRLINLFKQKFQSKKIANHPRLLEPNNFAQELSEVNPVM